MTRGLTLVVACLSLTVVAAEPAVETVLLRYTFEPGEQLVSRVSHRAVTETTMEGRTETVETRTDSTRTWTVVGVAADGTATLEQAVADVTMASRTSERGEVRWESAGGEPPPPGYEAVPASLGVPLVRLRVSPEGRIFERQELRPCPAAANGDLVVVPLPDQPVAPGHEWTVPDELVVEVPGGPRKLVRTRIRYRLEAVREGVATIAIDTTVLTPVDDPRLESRLLERVWNGSLRFDIEAGRILGRRTSLDRRLVGFGGPQSSVRYQASLEERLVEDGD